MKFYVVTATNAQQLEHVPIFTCKQQAFHHLRSWARVSYENETAQLKQIHFEGTQQEQIISAWCGVADAVSIVHTMSGSIPKKEWNLDTDGRYLVRGVYE